MIYQLLICTVPLALWFAVIGEINLFSMKAIDKYIFGWGNYWFIIDYIGLVLFAPVLNLIVENASKQVLQIFLINSLILIVLFDLILRSTVLGMEGGYSLLWFVYLYLLARYMRLYGCEWIVKYRWTIILVCLVMQTVLLYYHLASNRYTNPLILFPAICLMFVFKDFTFHSKVVNYMASGTLMAYMLHMQPCLTDEIRGFLNRLYRENGYYLYICEVIGMIVALYLVAVIIDKFQAMGWKFFTRKLLH